MPTDPISAESSKADPRDLHTNPLQQLREFISAVHVMKMYAIAQGIAIPEAAQQRLVALVPIETAVAKASGDNRDELPPEVDISKALGLALQSHAALSKVVAPATPASIRYTEPPKSVREFRQRQTILYFLIVLALISLALYVVTLISQSLLAVSSSQLRDVLKNTQAFEDEVSKLEGLMADLPNLGSEIDPILANLERQSDALYDATHSLSGSARVQWPQDKIKPVLFAVKDRPVAENIAIAVVTIRNALIPVRQGVHNELRSQWFPALLEELLNIFAAMLGAAFYTLYTAHSYVVRRVFDRSYASHYIVRFVLGIVAGVILANFGQSLLDQASGDSAPETVITLTQTLLALIGGYSADAVNAILTRVADLLTTLVRGDSRQAVQREMEAEVKAKKAEADEETASARRAEHDRLQNIYTKAVEKKVPKEVLDEIKKRLDELGGNTNGSPDTNDDKPNAE